MSALRVFDGRLMNMMVVVGRSISVTTRSCDGGCPKIGVTERKLGRKDGGIRSGRRVRVVGISEVLA